MIIESLRLNVRKLIIKYTADNRRKQLKNTNFTIISNNCWGGAVYESYGLQKQSPTVGLFFMASDYIKFVSRLREYLLAKLTFVKPGDSRWKETSQIPQNQKTGSYPVGVLTLLDGESIEIFFLHYRSEKEAIDKWDRRCQRVNWDKMLVKFNDQNGCSEKEVMEFMKLPFDNKLFFTCKEWDVMNKGDYYCIKQWPKHNSIMASYEPIGKRKNIDIDAIINSL